MRSWISGSESGENGVRQDVFEKPAGIGRGIRPSPIQAG